MRYTFDCPYSDNNRQYMKYNCLLKNKKHKEKHSPCINSHQSLNPNIVYYLGTYNNFKALIGMFYKPDDKDNKLPWHYLKIL